MCAIRSDGKREGLSDLRRVSALLLTLASFGAAAGELSVEVRQVKPNGGAVIVALYDKAEAFPKFDRTLAVKTAEARTASVQVAFGDLGPGRYAVAAYQDQNGNGRLDKNFFGVPTEPYGFSNDARGSMGPPSFDAAAVDPSATPNIVINLH
ncbi:MAG TPA: DUF2141 domain-containing protein [Burkholderiaceae bacterium]|jgi:uncharacterized protein (DUF2141 family)|nr:DUF2141 domain-containing protein [Burkholderiaceae bacterium]